MQRNFRNWLEGFSEYCSDLQVHASFVEWSAISVIAAALERKVWIDFKGKYLFPNMFIVLESPAAVGRKTSTSSMAIDLLKAAGPIQFAPSTGTQAALIDGLLEAGINRQIVVAEKTHNMSAMYAYAPEAVMLLKESFGSITELFTDWYDCYPGTWSMEPERAWTKSTKMHGTIRIYNVCLNALLCTTPAYLDKFLSKQDALGGFASRCVFVYEDSLPSKDFTWEEHEDNSGKQDLRAKLIADLKEIHALKGEWKVTKDFRDLFISFKNTHDKWLVENANDPLAAFKARKDVNILKIAQVLAASKSSTLKLEKSHLEEAISFYEKIEKSMPKVFSKMHNDTHSALLKDLWALVREKKEISLREIKIRFAARVKNNNELIDKINMLKDMSYIELSQKPEVPRAVFVKAIADKDIHIG